MLERFRSELKNEPIVLAHHPLCGRFDDHFFVIRGRKVCRGCLTVYPTAAIVLPALFLLGYTDFTGLFYLSLGLFLVNLIRLSIHRSELSNMVFNVILGACLATTLYSFKYCPPGLFVPYALFVLVTYVVFMSYRGMRMLNGCKKCSDYGSFPACFTKEKKL